MFCSRIDPMVNDAFNKGWISGPPEELQTLMEVLSIACDYSDIAREVIYKAFYLKVKIFICDELYSLGTYTHVANILNFRKSIFNNIKSEIGQILLAAILIHEARHACQYSQSERKKDWVRLYNNWTNIIMHTCLSEADAKAFEIASMYQLAENFGINNDNTIDILANKTKLIYIHFINEYKKHHDMRKTLEFVSRISNWKYGDYYKSLSIKEYKCYPDDNAVIIHPNEWVRLLNLMYKNAPYMDIPKLTKECLCLRTEDYEQIKRNLEKEQKKDNSLEYFSVKVPKKCDNNAKKEYEIIPAQKCFIF